jgi:hypothetical protein
MMEDGSAVKGVREEMQKLNTFCKLIVAAVGNGTIVVPPMPLLEDVDLSSLVPMSMMNATTDGHVPISLDLAAYNGQFHDTNNGTDATLPVSSSVGFGSSVLLTLGIILSLV